MMSQLNVRRGRDLRVIASRVAALVALGVGVVAGVGCDGSGGGGGEGGGGSGTGGSGTGGSATGGSGATSQVENPAGCPGTAPEYGEESCSEAGLICEYTRDDGCPIVRVCEEGLMWTWGEDHPLEGTPCSDVGQACEYSPYDCGANGFNAVCEDGGWHITIVEDPQPC